MVAPMSVTRIEPSPMALSKTTNITVIDQKDEEQAYTSAVDRLVRKLDRRLLLFLVFLEISSAINLVSIGTCSELNDSSLKISL